MRGLSGRARAYLGLVALAGLAVVIVASLADPPDRDDWALTAGLAAVAALAQLFEVRTPSNKAYNGTIAFLLTAAVLLPPLGWVTVAVAPFVLEQLRRPKPAYIQLFNASSHLLATAAAAGAFQLAASE